ncbi:MAG TPA: hypothetical protein ENJ95_16200 [Bacteroidetes bacterium]|nr:hypothetical protein [Bacteroidota bacterium]
MRFQLSAIILLVASPIFLKAQGPRVEGSFDIVPPKDILVECVEDYNDLSVTGNATVIGADDNYKLSHKDISATLNDCGEGVITRRFSATNSNGQVVNADQKIQVIKKGPASVQFPASYCAPGPRHPKDLQPDKLPEGYGRPIVYQGGCNNLEIGYEDEVMKKEKRFWILRKWTLCDPCNRGQCETYNQLLAAEYSPVFGGHDFQESGNNTGSFDLLQNRPNPFSEGTVIGFVLPKTAYIHLAVQSVDGRVLQTYEGEYPAGYHEITYNTQGRAGEGILFYTLTTPTDKATKRMVLTW